MKIKVDPRLVDDMRKTIRDSRSQMVENRQRRKEVIKQIRSLKNNIKSGENLCSKLEVGKIPGGEYVRDDLKQKRGALTQLRNDLLLAEFQYTITQSVCRAVHRLLDRLNEPFDPERACSAGRGKK